MHRTWVDTVQNVGQRSVIDSPESAILRAPSSPSPKTLAYYEVPTIGSGTHEDPFRAQIPEEIVETPKPNPKHIEKKHDLLKAKGWTTEEIKTFVPEAFRTEKINRLALTTSVHIPSESNNGKPVHGTCILRVSASESPGMRSIPERVKAFTDMPKSIKLKRDEAVNLALERDDKLFIHDLVPCAKHPESSTSKCCKEYIEWREKTVGLKRDLIDDKLMAHYVKEDKW